LSIAAAPFFPLAVNHIMPPTVVRVKEQNAFTRWDGSLVRRRLAA
jgi:hypothetical protein